jgi:hypothetical protein
MSFSFSGAGATMLRPSSLALKNQFATKKMGSPHLVSPMFDMLFICGLAPWILGLATFLLTGGQIVSGSNSPASSHPWFTASFVAVSFIIGESHQFTSILRYYGSFKRRKKKYRLERVPFWLIYVAALVALAAIFMPNSLSRDFIQSATGPLFLFIFSIAIGLFPSALLHHFIAQAVAVGQMYCKMEGYTFGRSEKLTLRIISWLLLLTGTLTIAQPFFTSINLTSMALPLFEETKLLSIDSFKMLMNISMYATIFAICAFGFNALMRGFVHNEWMPVKTAMLWINFALFVLVPLPAMLYVWLFVPIFFHATQHWAVAWSTHKAESVENATIEGSSKVPIISFCRFLLPIMFTTCVVLFMPLVLSPGHLQGFVPAGMDATLNVFLSMFVFYLHYFADRVVWRPKS